MQGDKQRCIHALVHEEALARELEGIAEALDAVLRRAARPTDVDREASVCLVEAGLLCNRDDRATLEEQLEPQAELILLGEPQQREQLGSWLRAGRAFYLSMPLNHHHLKELLRDILSEQSSGSRRNRTPQAPEVDQFGLLYGSSDSMQELYRHVRKAALTDATLLICGESGTGKELIARTAHSYSERSDSGFESINCGAIPAELLESELFGHEKGSFTGAERSHRGLFERAGEGTLFLDEITEMPLSAQTRLLRVLESGHFRRVGGQQELRCNARIMAASNRDPMQAIADGELRQDLYYRIGQMQVHAPPLRERGEDIVHLAHLFTRVYAQQTGRSIQLSKGAEQALREHPWPGNVRELRHCIHTAARLSRGTIHPSDLDLRTGAAAPASSPPASGSTTPADSDRLYPGLRMADMERRLIELTLQETANNKEQAARLLGISVRTLYNRLSHYRKADSEADNRAGHTLAAGVSDHSLD